MKHKITLTFNDETDTIRCGLRQEWISGKRGSGAKTEEINLSCGAGLGQPWLIFTKTAQGTTRRMVADIRELITQLDALEIRAESGQ